jgi:hypothetical protein
MTRIKCKTPSTGRPVNFTVSSVGTDWTTLAEAPDFSVPDASNIFPSRDPGDANRAIRAGEIFFMTPLYARNKTALECGIEVRLLLENGTAVECPGLMAVPGNDTAIVPVQGRSLLKRNYLGASGDRLQVRATRAGVLDLWTTAEEKPSAEHIGVV